MFVMILGAWAVYAGVAAWAVAFDADADFGAHGVLAVFLVSAVAAPCTATWLIAEALNTWQRRRLLIRGIGGRWWRRAAAGLATGTLGFLLGTILLALADSVIPDGVALGVGAVLSTALLFAFLPRVKRGRCVNCQYDLSGMTIASAGVCPECGEGVMKGL